MAWIAGAVVLGLLVFSAGFRKFAGVLILIGAVGGLGAWLYEQNEERMSKERVKPGDLLFQDVSLISDYGGYNLVGRVTNNSDRFTLKAIAVKLVFRDCALDNDKNCVAVAEDEKHIYLKIPPRQARDFKEYVYMRSDTKFRGKMAWSYTLLHTEAE